MNDSTSYNWSTISIVDFDHQVPTNFLSNFISNGLKVDESFKSKDDGQLATEANIIDEAEFVVEIPKEALRRRQSAVNITASTAKLAEALDVFKIIFDDLDKSKARVCTVKALPKFNAAVKKLQRLILNPSRNSHNWPKHYSRL